MRQSCEVTRNGFALKGLLGFPPSGYQISGLLSHFFKLLADYRAIKAINGDVKPIMFFPFHYKVRLKIRSIGFVVARLRDHVDEETPCPRLCDLGERPRKGVFAVLVGCVTGR